MITDEKTLKARREGKRVCLKCGKRYDPYKFRVVVKGGQYLSMGLCSKCAEEDRTEVIDI